MDLGISKKVQPLLEQVRSMVRNDIMPLEEEYFAEVGTATGGERFVFTPRQEEIRESLKDKAKKLGLWNFWLTDSEHGYGLSTVEYAHLAEEMGWSHLAPEVFNCAAPDTGNMEVIERYGTQEQKDKWLKPLLEGKIRSAYVMTEPNVASSDATNISMPAVLKGGQWVMNGEKVWSSGAGDPRCEIYIVMVKTNPDGPRHAQHSMILVPANTPGIEKVRAMQIFGADDAPHGHLHLRFTDVKVPEDHIIAGPGRGFEVAQGRLGPGRIHHCMRAVGQAERALELLCKRSVSRVAFGRPLAKLGANYDIIANCRIEIEQTRLLCLKAAWMMDTRGVKEAQTFISMIKVAAPSVALQVVDEAIQMHGGFGVSQDTPLASMWTALRTLRFADGPDAVHRMQVARQELRHYVNEKV
ncbi:MAG: acyl-CoA dehydrogenase family protein [Robiginitomaculum sp.]|nr:acyl-CoA dehydrogenase family protein [Robiginitomaculum sp.]MDQ7078289.1 acyl-CoA dehydrogenase family protein [Robiginitomaculum sp.]